MSWLATRARAFRRSVGRTALVRHQAGALLSTLVDFSVMMAAVSLGGIAPAAGTALGAACGGLVSFMLGRRWIFRSAEGRPAAQGARYALVSLTSLLLNSGGEHLLASVAHLQYVASRIVVSVAVSVLWNFPMQRSFVFRAPTPSKSR